MSENAPSNSVAALREARRRKILENSSNRLKRIEGLNSSSEKSSKEFLECKSEPDISKHNSEVKEKPKQELNTKLSEFLKQNEELNEINNFFLKSQNELFKDSAEGEVEVEESVPETIKENKEIGITEILIRKRVHYILLAVIVNFLFYINSGYLFYENIFCPYFSVKVIELLSRKEEKRDVLSIQNIFLATLPKGVQKFTKIVLTALLTLFSDLFLYLFCFIIGAKIINDH